MNHRRTLLAALGAGALVNPLAARAQQPPAKPRRIGFVSQGTTESNANNLAAFRAGMAALGWMDGRDYVIDARYANNSLPAFAERAADVAATLPDLLLVPADQGVRLLMEKTRTIPIVVATSQDPVGSQIAASLRRPGGNVTGLTSLAVELSGKRLQLLKEAFPRVAHVALLIEPGNVGGTLQANEIEKAAARLGMRVTPVEVRQVADIEAGVKRGAALGAQAWVVGSGPIAGSQRQSIVDRINRLKVPAMFAQSSFADAGGLMSYAASATDNYRRAAEYVDKIFKGAKPGELPIQQPTRFELVVNLKTAKAIGLTVPPIVMLQADRVIE